MKVTNNRGSTERRPTAGSSWMFYVVLVVPGSVERERVMVK